MAHQEPPLCVLPSGQPVWADQLESPLSRRVRQAMAWLVVACLFIAMCLAGSMDVVR